MLWISVTADIWKGIFSGYMYVMQRALLLTEVFTCSVFHSNWFCSWTTWHLLQENHTQLKAGDLTAVSEAALRFSRNCIRRLYKPILTGYTLAPYSPWTEALFIVLWAVATSSTASCNFAVSYSLSGSLLLWHWLWLQFWLLSAVEALEDNKSFQLSVGKEGAAVIGKEQSKGGDWTRKGSVGFVGTPWRLSLSLVGLCVSVHSIHLL